MIAKLLFPSFIVKRFIADEDRRVRFYNLANIYISLLFWHAVVLGIAIVSLDQCTDVLYSQPKSSGYCHYYNFALYGFIGVMVACVFANVGLSLWYHYFNKYKRTIAETPTYVEDSVFILATLYKESKEDINQLIDSVDADGYENLLIVFVLDGPFCAETLFGDVFGCKRFTQTVAFNGNTLHYQHIMHRGLPFFVIIKEENAGKKDSQCIFYDLMNLCASDRQIEHELYPLLEYLSMRVDVENFKYILILDGDTIVEENDTIKKMVHIMNSHDDHMVICGTTKVLNKNQNLIAMSQCFEYFISHLLLKNFETALFNTLVMSGCFSMIRIRMNDRVLINQDILDEYNKNPENLIEDNLLKFGEDRYLTSLLLCAYPDKKIQYVPSVSCITEVPSTLGQLVKQRRRWSNSLIACHIFLLRSKFISIRLYLIILIELSVILLLPILIIVGVVSFIVAMAAQGYSLFPVIITGNIFMLGFYITVLSGDWKMLAYFVPYMSVAYIYNIIIPYDSLLRFNVVEWNSISDIDSDDTSASDGGEYVLAQ